MNYLIPILLAILGSGALIIIGILYALSHYSQIKLFISDFFRAIGWLGKGVRKVSVSSELEGTLNGVINHFNQNFSSPILPNCKIQWVTNDNHRNILRTNEAIVCVSFDKKDHELNYYNATYNFIKTALIANAKPFLKEQTSKAIDLVSTKFILKQYRREALRTFNEKFKVVEPDTKEVFYRLEETEDNALFNTLLLPEFHYVGETLNDKTPSATIQRETEEFIQWFYELATRDLDDRTKLNFERTFLKVGVILVAKDSTYRQAGIEAYTKWAEKYAAENYNAVYILSRGYGRNKIANEVANKLVQTKGFEQVNKNTVSKRTDEEGKQVIITTICLRPNLTAIIYHAWEHVKKRHAEKKPVIGIIETVTDEMVIVNVSGLKVTIPKQQLSAAQITNASKLFREDQELELNVLEIDQTQENIRLSNVDTKTDPKKLIDSNLSNEDPISGQIKRIQKDRDQQDKGLLVYCSSLERNVFVPRSKATYSRFTDLAKKYPVDLEVQILLQDFSFDFGDYTGEISDLDNPYESNTYKTLEVGQNIEVVIKEKQEKFLTCEIIEGLECRLYANELSWDESECKTDDFGIDKSLTVKIYHIDREKNFIYVSLKQCSQSPQQTFFESNKGTVLEAEVTNINDNLGVFCNVSGQEKEDFVHWSEVEWGNISPLSKSYKIGDNIQVTPLEFDRNYNSIKYSIKRVYPQEYDTFKSTYNEGEVLEGKIIKCYPSVCIVELVYSNCKVRAYIHQSRVSQYCFLHEGDIEKFLPLGEKFSFIVTQFHDRFQTVELCRKTYLNTCSSVELGEANTVKHIITHGRKSFFYSNNLEGYVTNVSRSLQSGEEIEVIPISTNSSEFSLID